MPETLAELSKLRVVDLKQRLVEVGLPVGGLKAELVNRLHQYLITSKDVHEGSVSSSNASEEHDIGHSEKEKAPGTGAQSLSVPIETLSPPVPAISPSFCDADATAVLPSKPVPPTPAPLEQEPVLQQSPSALVPLQPPVPVLQNLHPPPLLKTPPPSVSLLQSPPATILQHASASPLLNIPSVQTVSSPATKPPPLMSITIEPPPSLDQELLMQQKVRQQQILLEQQQISQKQEDLFRLQQQALLEKQRDENEKQAHLLRLQHEALKQNEDEQAQLQALGLKHGSGVSSAEDSSTPTSGESSCTSSVAGVGALMAALQQRQQPPPSILGSSPLIGGPGPGLLQRPPPRPQPHVGLMGHAPPLAGKLAVGGAQGEAIKAGLNERMSVRTARPPPQIGVPPVSAETSRPRHPVHSEEKPPPLMSLQVSAPADDVKDVRLPQALEEALAYKHERAKEVGVTLDEEEDDERGSDNEDKEAEDDDADESMEFNEWMPANTDMRGHQEWNKRTMTVEVNGTVEKKQEEEEYDEEDDGEREDDEDRDVEIISSTKTSKKDKIKKKRKKKKKKKARHSGVKSWVQKQFEEERLKKEASLKKKRQPVEPSIDVRYIQEEIELDYSDPIHRHFAKVFENFKISEPVAAPVEEVKKEAAVVATPLPPINLGDLKKVPKLAEDDDSDNEDDNKPKVSKRKLKLLRRMSIAELKQTVGRPDVVEMHDVTARDPKLLVHLKATRNTVPVPRHWCFKRKYLQGKRGIEKPPFELPDFIKRTGIMEMRAALQEKEDQKTLKAKMRDKVRPKMGKIDIDYQKLHDAFFKWQCKPEMTIHGDLYYEGKEFETKMKDKKPGEMSDDLRIALGMPIGANAHKVPPPWLIAMQRYGPPPSYPNLKIPGLNAPIPEGCSFGYHAGGWGKPPVDNMGKPIYGDVFGTQNKEHEMPMVEEEVEKSHWGELESESEEESEEESSEEEEEDTSGLVTPGETGLVTPSGISSLPAGLETPDMIELRKKHLEPEVEGGETPALYTILPERRVEGAAGRAMMGSTHTYDLSAAMGGAPRQGSQGVEVALDPSELDLVDTDAMAARYEATIREQQAGDDQDFSDMVAEHAAKQRNKRRRLQNQDQSKPAKKYKDFKF